MRSSVGGGALCEEGIAVRVLELTWGMVGFGREDMGRRAAIERVVAVVAVVRRVASTSRDHVRVERGDTSACWLTSTKDGKAQEILQKTSDSQRSKAQTATRYVLEASHGSSSFYRADTAFTCLFCHHDKSVTVRLDRKEGIAQLVCRVCDQRYQSKVNREPPWPRPVTPPHDCTFQI